MQMSQVVMSYTQPNFDQIWWKKISRPNLSEIFDYLINYFSKKWVGRAMGNETFYGDGLMNLLVYSWRVHFTWFDCNVLHNMSLKVLLPWQHIEFQTSPILKAFLAMFAVLILLFANGASSIIQQAYKHVSWSFWPCLTFFKLK